MLFDPAGFLWRDHSDGLFVDQGLPFADLGLIDYCLQKRFIIGNWNLFLGSLIIVLGNKGFNGIVLRSLKSLPQLMRFLQFRNKLIPHMQSGAHPGNLAMHQVSELCAPVGQWPHQHFFYDWPVRLQLLPQSNGEQPLA